MDRRPARAASAGPQGAARGTRLAIRKWPSRAARAPARRVLEETIATTHGRGGRQVMRKIKHAKLSLKKETLQTLVESQLTGIAGGAAQQTNETGCTAIACP